jgi:hypothetical protein
MMFLMIVIFFFGFTVFFPRRSVYSDSFSYTLLIVRPWTTVVKKTIA